MSDRRKYHRQSRLLRLRFKWEDHVEDAVTTDVSVGGAFVNTSVFPSEGTRMSLLYLPDQGPKVAFGCVVTRVIDPLSRISVVPGIGVKWLGATTRGSTEYLESALTRLFGQPVAVTVSPNGQASWLASISTEAVAVRSQSAVVRTMQSDLEQIRGHQAVTEVLSAVPSDLNLEATFYVNRVPIVGKVSNLGRQRLRVQTYAPLPTIGDVTTCQLSYGYRGTGGTARIVCVVAAVHDGAEPGFELELVRVKNLNGVALEDFIDALLRHSGRSVNPGIAETAAPGRRVGGRRG